MYIVKYNIEFDNDAVKQNIDRITNQIFKLLPSREEGGDWQTPLQNLILEITGMKALWIDQVELFSLLCKMEALTSLTEEDDFFVIIGSDGIWDVINEGELFKIGNEKKLSSEAFSKKIMDIAKERDTRDNSSCIVIKVNKNI